MTKRARQIYLFILIAFSVITLPSILLYASGYRFDITNLSINKTGSLSIITLPKDAKVKIVNTSVLEKTPAIINQLVAGEYTVEVTKPGYATWQDRIQIESQETVLLQNILLFITESTPTPLSKYPDNLPSAGLEEKIKDFSPDIQYVFSELNISSDNYIVSTNAPWITVLDKTSEELYLIREQANDMEVVELADKVIGFDWDLETEELLYYTAHEVVLYNNTTGSSQVIIRQSQPITEAIWHSRGSYIMIASEHTITAIETRLTDTPNSAVVYYGDKPSVLGLNDKGNYLYFIDKNVPYSLKIQ